MSTLITSDLHLTDHPQDEYRWEIFPFLAKQAKRKNAKTVIIAGDLTHEKDAHTSALLNRVVGEAKMLRDKNIRVHFLMGNHDFDKDINNPFFKFLHLPELGIFFHTKRTTQKIGGERVLMLPYTKDPQHDWRRLKFTADYAVIHQPIAGAEASNGTRVDGVPQDFIDSLGIPVVAGDIHKPQTLGNAIYCGSPHPTRFGEEHKPRILHRTKKEFKSIPRVTIKKASVELQSTDDLEKQLQAYSYGDHLKITLQLKREDLYTWSAEATTIKNYCLENDLYLASLELKELTSRRKRLKQADRPDVELVASKDIFTDYCKSMKIEKQLRSSGKKYLP